MKMKVLATLALFVVAAGAQAATLSINDITILPGTPTVAVPILISPDNPAETVGAMNISFAAGAASDAIPILASGTEFAGTIWPTPHGSNALVFPLTPGVHGVFSVAAAISPLQVAANGTVITYTLDTSALPAGTYALNPNFIHPISGAGTTADTSLTFQGGLLTVAIPEPSTIALTVIFAVLGLGVVIKRRRG